MAVTTDDQGIENVILGDVEGSVTQIGTDGNDTAGTVRNTVVGNVKGSVIQAGDISGPLTF